ncbi:MAG: protein-(glutamine-N5) methyltransferase, release factor-specific [Candidatus Omnitrophica bacterium CG11_big_fil_rev_8_21_14_0_20_42_13]|uniref:Release factor glutamine methyltransferase n=1 Tax=Candidatus Ghiorseimicrobium undicola TaxID=1974746 RepID=A0A2H0LWS8_9BACT|nr:MAG: protein-(glutamine-N5) methyltransferase, release factor-specific [Candidatus Omnitrophica bacterium CG11_big_fil_rev_8_21_14_0_20_42_13]
MNEHELILTSLLDCARHELYLKGRTLNYEQLTFLNNALRMRAAGRPLQYILGSTEFMGLKFKVTEGVFIPRPETEILAEAVIKRVRELKSQSVKILDIGTGSGCIAVSLARFFPEAVITATDISEQALNLARENAASNGVSDRIKFIQCNILPQYSILNTQYEIIVSNPPYVSSCDIVGLDKEVKCEPIIALDGGPDGLSFYREIIDQSPRYLKDDALLIMEIGYNQAGAVKEITESQGAFKLLETIKDYNAIDRVIVMQNLKCKIQS